MNSNQTNTNVLVVKCYDNTHQVCADLGVYVRANAPDMKARDKARRVLIVHSDMQYPRDLLYYLHGAFDELHYRSWSKAVDSGNEGEYAKHHARADFYRRIADWANACYDLVKEAPVIKDAEDDSDPYIKPSPKADMVEHALTVLKDRLTSAGCGKWRIDNAAALFRSVVLERPIGATVLDILERFGDEASELSWDGEYDAAVFWDACVQISDDLRSDLATDQRKTAPVTVPDAVLWEVAGDPNRTLYRTEKDAMRATRKLFPDEYVTLRYARLQRHNVKFFN